MSPISSESNINLDTAFLSDLNCKDENRNAVINSAVSLPRYKTIILVFFFAVIGFLLPGLYAHKYGFPVPHIHDEFSYLLAADTFASGRLSNPTPEFYEHFESPHLLMTPTYMSKFPPAQGFILALGQIIFGQPIYGVWISCGLLAAALFWMLSVWTDLRWAILGTVIMLFFVGTASYWAQSFWGGTMAAFGGCIFFGSFRRLLDKIYLSGFLLLITGGTILVNSRPLEGLLAMTPALFVLLIRLIRDKTNSFSQKFYKFVLPSALLTLIFTAAIGYYNFRITGNAFAFPYTVHQKQYFSTPLFVFQPPLQSELRGSPRLRTLYNELDSSPPLWYFGDYGLPRRKSVEIVFAIFYLLKHLPFFLISVPFTIFLYALLIPVLKKDRLMVFVSGTIIFTILGMSLASYWDKPHYSAPLAGCVYLLLMAVIKYSYETLKIRAKEKGIVLFFIIFALCMYNGWLLSFSDFYFPYFPISSDINRLDNLKDGKEVLMSFPLRATYFKEGVEEYFEKFPEKYLALVRYDEDQSYYDEVVYNKPDIEGSKFIWAYDFGEEKNRKLLEHYKDRKILQITVTRGTMTVKNYPAEK